YVEKFSTKWKKNRLSRVSLSVLRLALYEMLYEESIPESVSINEAVELAKKFGGEEDSAFVNGLLGAVSRSDKKLAAEEE
ncbi:MAG: transcription antitermination protein NusB, partial [Oscillospiraceae bacterium]|nr:transcription antitermination protein NusB [Oscillospiraceae bacterium]